MNHKTSHSQRGSALISAAVASCVLGIIAAGLLSYLSNEYNFNFRSRAWNQALHLAESGVEIGFSEINNQYYRGGFSVGFQSSRGWSLSSNVYSKVVSNLTDTTGNIVGTVSIKMTGISGINPIATAISTVATRPRGPTISRAVRATLYSSSMFPVGMLAKNKIDMNGNNISVDSYNSLTNYAFLGSLAYSTNSTYRNANGNIASNGSVTNSFSIGNADIYGVLYTGPGGTASIGANGSVGPTFTSASRATSVSAAESQGYVSHDFNVDVADVTLPAGAGSWGSGGISGNAISKDTLLGTGDYKVTGISLTSNDRKDTLEIATNSTVRIYVTGDVRLSGLSQIIIDPGATLQVYIAGTTVQLTGNGIINNSGKPIQNQWYGLPTSTSWSYTGNANWTGVIYAPQATVSFKGGGANGDASGAVVGNNVVMAGITKFHYDESLRASDTGAGFAVVTWIELRYVSGAWVP